MNLTMNLRPRQVLLGALAAATLTAGCTSGAAGDTTAVRDTTPDEVVTTTSIAPAGAHGASVGSGEGDTALDGSVMPETAQDTAAPAGDDGAAQAATSGPTTVPELVAAAPASELTNEGVLAAAVLIVSGGDLESAIADGVVTEAEAEAALAAIENGTLADYQD